MLSGSELSHPDITSHILHKTYSSMAYISLENKTTVLYDTELRGKYTAWGKWKFMADFVSKC